jgi:transposase InsO family protein
VVLASDWTILRLFPPLRAAWARIGAQAEVPITGANAKRVLFGAINVRTGHRVVLKRPRAGGAEARALFTELRRRYRAWGTLCLLLDRASGHTDRTTQALAAELNILLFWLPKHAPELNPMDQLWRPMKQYVAANRQAETIDQLADEAEAWILRLSPVDAQRKAGLLSRHSWLRSLLQDFWRPT